MCYPYDGSKAKFAPGFPVFFFLLLIVPGFLFAQKYVRKDFKTELSNGSYNVVPTPDGFLTISNSTIGSSAPVLGKFDSKFKRLYAHELGDLSGKIILSAYYIKGKLEIFYADNHGGVSLYSVEENKSVITGKSTSLFSVSLAKEYNFYEVGHSKDGKYYFIYNRNRLPDRNFGDEINGIVLNDSMRKLYNFSFSVKDGWYSRRTFDHVILGDGAMGFTYAIGRKGDRRNPRPYEYSFVYFDVTGKRRTHSMHGFPDGLIDQVKLFATGETPVFTALLAPNSKKGFVSNINGSYDPSTAKFSYFTTDFKDVEFLKQATDEYLTSIVEDGLPSGLTFDTSFNYADGSYAAIYQESSMNLYQSHHPAPTGGMGAPSYAVTRDFRGSIYIIKSDKDHKVQWIRGIAVNQFESDLSNFLGVAAAMDDQEGIHLFYYDNPKNTELEPRKRVPIVNTSTPSWNILVAAHIKPDGTTTKKEFYAGEAFEYGFRPSDVQYFKPGQLFYFALKKGKGLSTSAKKFYDKASYALGVITF